MIYRTWEEYWSNGKHGYSSAGRDIAKAIWVDFQETIEATRSDYERILIEDAVKQKKEYIARIRDVHNYLEEHEEKFGKKFWRWQWNRLEKENYNKELAMLLGLHVGDSLGATLEFQPARDRGSFQTEILGGGLCHWEKGEATDDTDLMICLLRSLVKCDGLDVKDLSLNFIEWFKGDPSDIGNTTRASIQSMIAGVDPIKCGQTAISSQGNGSLMRCAPLALFYEGDDLKKEAFNQASTTHAHKVCLECDYLFLTALNMALEGKDKEEIYSHVLELSKNCSPIYESLSKVKDIRWKDLKTGGFVIETLTAAFWGLLRTDNFEDALVEVINRGNDSDTIGAVTGALCGAYYGLDAIPERWLSVIKRGDEIKEIYDRTC